MYVLYLLEEYGSYDGNESYTYIRRVSDSIEALKAFVREQVAKKYPLRKRELVWCASDQDHGNEVDSTPLVARVNNTFAYYIVSVPSV